MKVASMSKERFPPIAAADMTEEQRVLSKGIRSAGTRTFLKGVDERRLGGMLDILLRRPQLMRAVLELSDTLREQALLPARLKELAILCIARRYKGQYAWFQHEPLALGAGLTQSVIDSIRDRRAPAGLQDDERAVLDFVNEWLQTSSVSEPTFVALRRVLPDDAVVELMVVVGYFWMGVMVLNVGQVPLPGSAEPALID